MTSVTCYSLKPPKLRYAPNLLMDYLEVETWNGVNPVQVEVPVALRESAVIFMIPTKKSEPAWVKFFRNDLGDNFSLPAATMPGAIVIMSVLQERKRHYFAFTFGTGRHLLKSEAVVRKFGLKVVLNAVFESDTARSTQQGTRLRSVDAKRVTANTVRMRHQTNQMAEFEAFDVDRERDLLHGVTGIPHDDTYWGPSLTGSDSLTINKEITFKDLPDLCKRLVKMSKSDKYKYRFAWLDDVAVVADEDLVGRLENHICEQLSSGSIGDLELAVPEVVDFERIESYILSSPRSQPFSGNDLKLSDYILGLQIDLRLPGIDGAFLRTQKIEATESGGQAWKSWKVWDCLTGEFSFEGHRYILDDGEFYEVSQNFYTQLEKDLARLIKPSTIALPKSKEGQAEAKYNEFAAASGFLLMDQKLIRISTSTSPIELCDLLGPDRQFIHVKRKLGSGSLSHLFAQGHTSADLFQTNADFRIRAKQVIKDQLSKAAARSLNPSKFDILSTSSSAPGAEVVYAIIADWNGSQFFDRLPFFSKVNLRLHATQLVNRGFKVSYLKIQTEP